MDARYKHIIGLDEPARTTVFLPWIGEFGWYLLTHVKRVHAYNATYKIAYIKRGHECLFPSVQEFVYDWEDIPDDRKAGVIPDPNYSKLVREITDKHGPDVKIVSHAEISWDEKESLAPHRFEPFNNNIYGLRADVVISPRKRNVDPQRNMDWQGIVNQFKARGLTVGVVGNKEATAQLNGIDCYASDYIDVDTDVELIKSATICVTQESGMAYLMMMCRKPVFMIDHDQKVPLRDLQRDPGVFFRVVLNPAACDWRRIIEPFKYFPPMP